MKQKGHEQAELKGNLELVKAFVNNFAQYSSSADYTVTADLKYNTINTFAQTFHSRKLSRRMNID